jgi:hypothetical protein
MPGWSNKEIAVIAIVVAVVGYGVITGMVKFGEWAGHHLAWLP